MNDERRRPERPAVRRQPRDRELREVVSYRWRDETRAYEWRARLPGREGDPLLLGRSRRTGAGYSFSAAQPWLEDAECRYLRDVRERLVRSLRARGMIE